MVIGGYSRLKIKKILNQNKEDIFLQIETSLQEYDTLLFSIEKQMETGGEKAISAIINDLDIQSKEDQDRFHQVSRRQRQDRSGGPARVAAGHRA